MSALHLNSIVLAIPFFIALILYMGAVALSNRRRKRWPTWRLASWTIGLCCVLLAVIGPLAEQAREDFFTHMVGHILLGMLGPLLMALAAPMTLLLRTLPVRVARTLTTILKSKLSRFVVDPVTASILNVGGLWILYGTDLYVRMHEYVILHLFIHFHVFIAGYVYTLSMISVDLSPHRTSYLYRSIVLTLSLAAHGVLSKWIYACPPQGVSSIEAEAGGMLMFYGGDAVEATLIFILCLQWYRSSRPAVLTRR